MMGLQFHLERFDIVTKTDIDAGTRQVAVTAETDCRTEYRVRERPLFHAGTEQVIVSVAGRSFRPGWNIFPSQPFVRFFSCLRHCRRRQAHLSHGQCGQCRGGGYIAEKRPAGLFFSAGIGSHSISPVIDVKVFQVSILRALF
jgi:hypothetical protein